MMSSHERAARGVTTPADGSLAADRRSPAPSFDALTRIAAQALRAPYAAVTLRRGDSLLDIVNTIGFEPVLGVTPDLTYSGLVFETGEPVVLNGTGGDPRPRPEKGPIKSGGAYLGCPVLNFDGTLIAVLSVGDGEARVWTPEEIVLLSDLAQLAITEMALTERLSQIDRSKRVLEAIVRASAEGDTGDTFLASIVQQLATTLGVRHVFISKALDSPPTQARIVAIWTDGHLGEKGEIRELHGTPCDEMLASSPCYVPTDVRRLYPGDPLLSRLDANTYLGVAILDAVGELQGTLAVLHDRPLDDPDVARAMLAVFATRVSLEFERQRSDLAIRESETRYRRLVEMAPDAIIVHADERIMYANSTAERMAGVPPGGLIGQSVMGFVKPESLALVKERLALMVAANGAPITLPLVEQQLRTPDGRDLVAEVASTVVTWDGRSAVQIVLRDITERKRTQEELRLRDEQLRQAQKMEAVGQLAGGVAHDFNNLLTVIKVHAEFLLADLQRGGTSAESAEEIGKAATRAAALTRQLLAFSRKQLMQSRRLDVNDVVSEAEKMLQRLIGEDIRISATLAPDLWEVMADPGQLGQVMMNLAVNARDAMPEGGSLHIETSNVEISERLPIGGTSVVPGDYVRITVSDTGTGMNAETSARAFEPFFTTKPTGLGTGLGLSTVYGIVKQSGGYVWVDSTPGQGTTFTILLPRTVAAAEPAKPPLQPAGAGSETVLLVEDEMSVRELAKRVLERSGYHVLEAANGKQALKLAAAYRERIDLVVTDVVMPEMGGRAMVEELRNIRPGIGSLFMTGYTDDDMLRRGAMPPGMYLLEKPFTSDRLNRAVRAVLDGVSQMGAA